MVPSVADIMDRWPSSYVFAADLGLKRGGEHARIMRLRGRIPEYYWPQLLEAARRRGIDLDEHTLRAAHSRKNGSVR